MRFPTIFRSLCPAPIRLAFLLMLLSGPPVFAQMWPPLPDFAARLINRLPCALAAVEQDQPGIANPFNPFVFPPRFAAELNARPMLVFMSHGKFQGPAAGIELHLDKDLQCPDKVSMIEIAARGQAGRFSVRVVYDAYMTTFQGKLGTFNWPSARFGGDIDLIQGNGFRAGIDGDFIWEKPSLSIDLPGPADILIQWNRPGTAGIHASYNPPTWGGLSSTIEARCRLPLTQESRVTEVELSAGVKSPETFLGTSGLRAGWRYSSFELRSASNDLDVTWWGVFGEYVYLY